MDCHKMEDRMLDAATGATLPAAAEAHLRECAACTERVAGLRSTMALLDEFVVPEPSPYFDSRFQARLREVQAQEAAPQGWMAWLRRPALGLAMLLLLALGLMLFRGGAELQPANLASNQPAPAAVAQAPATSAVDDLQELDKNHDLYAEFDLLDELATEETVNQ
jgi:anti-sigma factor RsiW